MNAIEERSFQGREAPPRGVLAVARESQSLSIAQVASQLKLSERQVAALEAGAFERLPGPVFVRGFVRNYARLLKLDPDRVLAEIAPDLPPQPAREQVPASQEIPFPSGAPERRWPKYLLLVLILVAGLLLHEFAWYAPSSVTVTKPAEVPVAIAPVEPPLPSEMVPLGVNAASANKSPDADFAGAPAGKDAGAAGEASPPAVDPFPAQATGANALHFVFEMDSWVEVRDRSGQAIFTQLNPAGTEQRVEGEPPYTLVIGNARGVRLTYNGRPIDLERHTKVSVARLTLE
jgi:cytoskeleton protein RodZ